MQAEKIKEYWENRKKLWRNIPYVEMQWEYSEPLRNHFVARRVNWATGDNLKTRKDYLLTETLAKHTLIYLDEYFVPDISSDLARNMNYSWLVISGEITRIPWSVVRRQEEVLYAPDDKTLREELARIEETFEINTGQSLDMPDTNFMIDVILHYEPENSIGIYKKDPDAAATSSNRLYHVKYRNETRKIVLDCHKHMAAYVKAKNLTIPGYAHYVHSGGI